MSSRAPRRMWPATSSTTSTRRPSSPPRSSPAERAPPHRPWCASPRRSASRATRSCSRPRSRSTATTIAGSNGGRLAGALFSFDHSELEGSLGADYSNLEETARNLTAEQVNDSVAALANAQRIVIVGVDQMAFFASYLRHTLSLLDIRAEIVASTGGESPPAARPDRRGHAGHHPFGGSGAPAAAAGDEARAAPRARAPWRYPTHHVGGRRARRADALLLLEQPFLRTVKHGADGARAGAGARSLRAG